MLETYLPQSGVVVARMKGVPVGFAALDGDTLAALFVRPSCQGRGIGRALLERIMSERECLRLAVYAKNESARRFCARNGFTVVGAGRCDHTGEEEILMEWRQKR